MPTTQSKLSAEEEEEFNKSRKEAMKFMAMIGPCVFMIVTGGQLLNQSRPLLVLDIYNKNAQNAAAKLAQLGSLGGVMEFAFNPLIGRLSDKFGRKPFLMLSPIVCCLLRLSVYLNPTNLTVITIERMFSVSVVTGFFTSMRAAINDKLSGKDLAISSGSIAVWAGMGVILGPFIEAFILRNFGAKYSFLTVAILNFFVTLRFATTLEETCPKEQRKEIDWVACNPFSFTQVLGISNVTQTLMGVLALQAFGEGRITQDINQLFLGQHLGWSHDLIGYFQSIYGLGIVLGGKFIKQSLTTLGSFGHTTMSHWTTAIGYMIRAFVQTPLGQYGGLLVMLPGGRKRDAVEAIVTDVSLANSDMGKGQIAAALSNFKSLATIFGPSLAGYMYSFGFRNGISGAPFYQIALFYVIADVLFRSLSKKEMGIDEE